MMLRQVVLMSTALLACAPLSAQRSGATLPEGEGKALVESACTECHGVGQILGSAGYESPERWREVFETMVQLPDREAERIARYLATHVPVRPERRPALVVGPVEIDIREWTAPTLGQRSRDPAEAPDGSIWWMGMWASLAGRIDAETGEMREYPLPPSARLHTIVPDAGGMIWYTSSGNATIARLDPATGEIAEYPTEVRDPHSAVFRPNGQLYFTAQGAHVLGRLDPRTGTGTELDTEPRPYGIQIDSKGTLWIAYNGTNKLGAMDPMTMQVPYYEVPGEASRLRRRAITSDDKVWYGNSTMGRIGRLDPETGEIREWASPSGPDSHPYAMAVIDDVISYNESGMRPDALVRFDPVTERFQSWPIPSGVGIVRNMWVTRDGDLLMHQRSTNTVGLVDIPRPRLTTWR